jgi:photosystem II stability/assembly factor-like uncharacterized protein
MKIILYIFIFIGTCCQFSCNSAEKVGTTAPAFTIDSFVVPNTVIRAIFPLSDQEVWFAGSNGKYGHTKNAGQTWEIDSISIDQKYLELRSLSITENGYIYLVSVANPAIVLKGHKDSLIWETCFIDRSESTFFDQIVFKDQNNGFLLSDPQDHCFNLLITQDAGESWKKIPCDQIPNTMDNEAPYAASNSNAQWLHNSIYFLSGGPNGSRFFYTENNGQNWQAVSIPMPMGGTMTGGYSLDFYDHKNGLVAGGNWDSTSSLGKHIALTHNRGKTWKSLPYKLPYISSCRWIPGSDTSQLIGLSGRAKNGSSSIIICDLKQDTFWEYANTNFLSMEFSSDSIAWLGGRNKIAKLQLK